MLARDNLSPQMKRLAHWLFAWVLASEGDVRRALNEADIAVALAPYDSTMRGMLRAGVNHGRQSGKRIGVERFRAPPDPNGFKFQNYNRGLALRYLGNTRSRSQPSSSRFTRTGTLLATLPSLSSAWVELMTPRRQVKLMLEKNDPKFTQAKWRKGMFYSDPSIMDREVADLAKADLPEK